MIFTKEIKIDNIIYSLWCRDDYEIAFCRKGGSNKKSGQIGFIDAFGDETYDFDIVNDCDNPLKAIRTIVNEFLNLIYKNNLPYLTFSATEKNRATLYKRIALKFLNSKKYQYCQIAEDEQKFLFVRN